MTNSVVIKVQMYILYDGSNVSYIIVHHYVPYIYMSYTYYYPKVLLTKYGVINEIQQRNLKHLKNILK